MDLAGREVEKQQELLDKEKHELERKIKAALKEQQSAVNYIPLHRQVISWAARQNVDVVQRADNWVEFAWIRVK